MPKQDAHMNFEVQFGFADAKKFQFLGKLPEISGRGCGDAFQGI